MGDHVDRGGLVLRVAPSGRRSWLVRYRPRIGSGRGKQRRLALGTLGGVLTLDLSALGWPGFAPPSALGLKEARECARAVVGLAAQGKDPLAILGDRHEREREAQREAARRAAEGTVTFGMLLDRFLEARRPDVRPNTMALWESLARSEVRPAFGDRDPRGIVRRELRLWHRSIGESGRRHWANRALELVAGVYRWAVREEALESSPCVDIQPFVERSRDRVLSHDELRAIWEALAVEPPAVADPFRLLLLTGARRGEVLGMTWAEVDLKARVWRIAAERSKTGMARPLPLSSSAMELLERRRAGDPKARWVFPSPARVVGALRSLQAPFRRVVDRSGISGWVIHDLRRTVRTELSALGVRPDVAEFVLGHALGGIRGVYDRHMPLAEAAAALEAWARRLHSIVTGEDQPASVVPFGRP